MVKEDKPKKVVTKKPRADKRKNVGKVAEVLVKNPNKTEQEIADETGLGAGTVHRAKKELEENGVKDPTINFIVGSSKDYLKALSKINIAKIEKTIKENLKENKDGKYSFIEGQDIHVKELVEYNKIGKEEMARLTVLGGSVTDEHGGLVSIQDLTFDSMNGTNSAG